MEQEGETPPNWLSVHKAISQRFQRIYFGNRLWGVCQNVMEIHTCAHEIELGVRHSTLREQVCLYTMREAAKIT